MSQIVDTATAKEFMKETLEKIEASALVDISDALEVKSERFKEVLGRSVIDNLNEEDFHEILRLIFSTRRKSKKILEQYPFETFKDHIRFFDNVIY